MPGNQSNRVVEWYSPTCSGHHRMESGSVWNTSSTRWSAWPAPVGILLAGSASVPWSPARQSAKKELVTRSKRELRPSTWLDYFGFEVIYNISRWFYCSRKSALYKLVVRQNALNNDRLKNRQSLNLFREVATRDFIHFFQSSIKMTRNERQIWKRKKIFTSSDGQEPKGSSPYERTCHIKTPKAHTSLAEE